MSAGHQPLRVHTNTHTQGAVSAAAQLLVGPDANHLLFTCVYFCGDDESRTHTHTHTGGSALLALLTGFPYESWTGEMIPPITMKRPVLCKYSLAFSANTHTGDKQEEGVK